MERKVHESGAEAMDVFLEEFKKLILADGFMACVWVIVDGKIQLTTCTTYNFPLEDRPIAEQQLREVNQSEAVLAMTPPPLPLADHLKGSNGGNARLNASRLEPEDPYGDPNSDYGKEMNPKGEDDDPISD